MACGAGEDYCGTQGVFGSEGGQVVDRMDEQDVGVKVEDEDEVVWFMNCMR